MPKTATAPWWVINATSGTPSQYVITQYPNKPQPANSAFAVTGPYDSQAAAVATVPSGATYSVQSWNALSGTFSAIGQAIQQATQTQFPSITNPLAGLADLNTFFSALTQKATWLRVGEVLAGVLILYAGLKAISTPAGQAPVHRTLKDTAKTAIKVVR